MGYGIHPRRHPWYPSLSGFLPKKNTKHVVRQKSGPWTYYSGKTQPRPFTVCSFCKAAQVATNKGWMYRKHFNTGTPMAGPVAQHACPTCAKDPKKVDRTSATPK